MTGPGAGGRRNCLAAAALVARGGLAALIAAGCAEGGGLAASPEGHPPAELQPPCGQAFGQAVDEEALGFSLAGTAAAVPRELEALAAFVSGRGEAGDVVELVAGAAADEERALPGGGRCPLLSSERLWLDERGGRLQAVAPGVIVASQLARGRQHAAAGRYAEARVAFDTAAAHERVELPALLLQIADSYAREGRWGEAEDRYRRASRAFPHAGEAWWGLGQALRRRGQRAEAVAAWSRALALRPGDARVVGVLRGDPFAQLLPPLPPPAVRVSEGTGRARWQLVAAPGRRLDHPQLRDEGLAYARCREAFRRSRELREAAAGRALPGWRWTPAEESICSLLWLRAYLAHRAAARNEDAGLEALADMARQGYSDERALHDLATRADARTPLLLDPLRRARLFQFVARYRGVPRQDAGWLFF